MNELILRSFLHIVACAARAKGQGAEGLIRGYVHSYLNRTLGPALAAEWAAYFDALRRAIAGDESDELIRMYCEAINEECPRGSRYELLVSLIDFFSAGPAVARPLGATRDDLLGRIARQLRIGRDDYANCLYLAQGQPHSITRQHDMLVVSATNPGFRGIRSLERPHLKGHLIFLLIPGANHLLFTYSGASHLAMNDNPLYSRRLYTLPVGQQIMGEGMAPVHHGEVIRAILRRPKQQPVWVEARDVRFNYSRRAQGVNGFTFAATSGELVGIMGGSGVGKSTLIKLLSGSLTPGQGEVLVNGRRIEGLEGYQALVGVLHQEESLVEELTVYENLYYSARLALGRTPETRIRALVAQALTDLDLLGCQHNRVGPPGNRQLSGGQRKRLAIAMEIVREPAILYADEPTSGLSSADSDVVMEILRRIALGGTLVVVNIHQPSSDIFRMFDRLIILDRGGIPIFTGTPIGAILHFKAHANRVDKHTSGCQTCGTLRPELLFELIEERRVDAQGDLLPQRKRAPQEWERAFRASAPWGSPPPPSPPIPSPKAPIAGAWVQFRTFFARNARAKLRNVEFMLLALLLPPLLAAVVSLFLRFSVAPDAAYAPYTFMDNPNTVTFIFICILASLFFGLTLSSEDVFRDCQLIARERFMGLSIRCYYHAKVGFHLLLSAYQALAYALIGSAIMELVGFTLQLWLLLLAVALFGNLVGLIISSAFRSLVAIYVLIPFLLIPQILFSGLVVRFDHLHPNLSSQTVVPVAGELMATRWATEAMITRYYMYNPYMRPYFPLRMEESEIRFRLLHLIPTLHQQLAPQARAGSLPPSLNRRLIGQGLALLSAGTRIAPPSLGSTSDAQLVDRSMAHIDRVRRALSQRFGQVTRELDAVTRQLYPSTPEGRARYQAMRRAHHNLAIDNLVRNRQYPIPIVIHRDAFIQRVDPIFHISPSPWGRSHYLAPYKRVGQALVPTYWYNLGALGLMILLGYIVLLSNGLSINARWRTVQRKPPGR